MARLDKKIGEAVYDDILVSTEPAALVTTVAVDASETPLVRGTVLVGEAGGNLKPASEALTADKYVAILADTVESAEAGDIVEAYKTGNFARTRLVTNGSYELTAADFNVLRKTGIQTTGMIEAVVD